MSVETMSAPAQSGTTPTTAPSMPSLEISPSISETRSFQAFDPSVFERPPKGFNNRDLFKSTEPMKPSFENSPRVSENVTSATNEPEVTFSTSKKDEKPEGKTKEPNLSIYKTTRPFEFSFAQVKEVGASKSSLEQTQVLASAKENLEKTNTGVKDDPVPEVIDTALAEENALSAASLELLASYMGRDSDVAIDREKAHDKFESLEPQTQAKVKEEVSMAVEVEKIMIDTGSTPQEAHQAVQNALGESLANKGLVEDLVLEEEETQEAGTASQKEEPEQQNQVTEEEDEPEQRISQDAKYVRDEDADRARKEDAKKAILKTALSNMGNKVSGKSIVEKMNQKPSLEEISEIIRRTSDEDGSHDEILQEYSQIEFDLQTEKPSDFQEVAQNAFDKLVEEKPAVKEARGGELVKMEDVQRVRNTEKAQSNRALRNAAR